LPLGNYLRGRINQRRSNEILEPTDDHKHANLLVTQREHRLEYAARNAGVQYSKQKEDFLLAVRRNDLTVTHGGNYIRISVVELHRPRLFPQELMFVVESFVPLGVLRKADIFFVARVEFRWAEAGEVYEVLKVDETPSVFLPLAAFLAVVEDEPHVEVEPRTETLLSQRMFRVDLHALGLLLVPDVQPR